MNFTEYQSAALRTAPDETRTDRLVHASLGLSTEVGEFVTPVKRMARYLASYNHTVKTNLAEELSDILWYVALAASALEVDLETIARENIDKLRKRFPDKFSPAAAEARADKGGLSAKES